MVIYMDKTKYTTLVNKYTPNENRLMNGLISFIIGGFIGVLGQGLIDLYSYFLDISSKQASTLMIITLIFLSCLLTAIGIFDEAVNFARCGLIIPITGFAHSVMSSTIEYKREGIVTGMGANMFKLAGSVIMCGVVSAYFFSILRYFIIGG